MDDSKNLLFWNCIIGLCGLYIAGYEDSIPCGEFVTCNKGTDAVSRRSNS